MQACRLYYVIQLVENEDSEYFVFTRWGRVGESGTVQQVGPLDRAAGEKQFNSKFKEKTDNAWDARASFVTKERKYSLVVLEHDSPAAAAACAAGGGKGKEEASSKGKGKEEAVTKVMCSLRTPSLVMCSLRTPSLVMCSLRVRARRKPSQR